jgi:hypothetical protein
MDGGLTPIRFFFHDEEDGYSWPARKGSPDTQAVDGELPLHSRKAPSDIEVHEAELSQFKQLKITFAVVSDRGFITFSPDGMSSWSHSGYMSRAAMAYEDFDCWL